MKKNKVVFLLGTNLGDRCLNLEEALINIESRVGEIILKSKIEETEPVGFTAEMDFYNQLIEVETLLSPVSVLREIKEIEKDMGRVYSIPNEGEKYVSRIIDIDLLYYNSLNFQSSKLVIPHPQIVERKFVSLMINNFK